jgi:hypothetical protein
MNKDKDTQNCRQRDYRTAGESVVNVVISTALHIKSSLVSTRNYFLE